MGLTLPKNFEEYPEEVKQVIIDHEIANDSETFKPLTERYLLLGTFAGLR
jgi:hypothetical protein